MSKTVGDYQLKEKIGKGSYADVYKGTHKVTGQKYAIKTISKDILSEPKLLAGLESEIKIMREFVHENIVCLHEYFSSEKNFYLVLELCEGGDLSKFIKKKKRLDERLAHNFLAQITSGLAFLHEKNFIHRDLKPANVLLSEFSDNAVLKLADFGFARQLSVASLAQTRCGTPLYMAPEILESKDYDGKADIWSVGCIFYEMLVGTSPFKGANEGDLLMNIKTKELNVPKDVILSEVSIQILIKLLERHPVRRAALPQLVALCAHITSNPPPLPLESGSNQNNNSESVPGGGFDDHSLALPLSSPPAGYDTKAPGTETRRRPSSGNIPVSDLPAQPPRPEPSFISPVKGNPGNYPGGPTAGNLRGMFAPDSTATPPAPMSNVYPDSRSNTAYNSPAAPESQHTRRNSGTYTDSLGSKTVRAPYASPPSTTNNNNYNTYNSPNVNSNNKYPSPSSSPPTSNMFAANHNNNNNNNGFSMQTSRNARSAPTHSSSAAIASSPGTIGLMGNLIAYVFNPSPSPSAGMNESARAQAQYKQQQQQQQQQHGRSISLDRATPPNFGLNQPNSNNYLNYAHTSSGTPPPAGGGNRARTQSTQGNIQGAPNNRIREDHFTFAEQQQQQQQQDSSMYGNSGYNTSNNTSNNNNNNMNSKGSSSALSVDDDFVLIHNSSTERSDAAIRESRETENRERERSNYTGPPALANQPSQHASQANSTSTSFSGSGPNSTALPAFQPPQPVPVAQPSVATQVQSNRPHNTSHAEMVTQQQQQQLQQQSYHLEEEVRTHEAAATQAFNASLAQKCEVYCAVAGSITALADQFVREVLLTSQQLSKHDQKHPSEKPARPRAASMDMTDAGDDEEEEEEEGIAGFLQQPQDSLHSHASHNSSMHRPAQRQASVDRYLSACSLYLHALSILANLLKSFNTNASGYSSEGSDHLHPALQKLKADVNSVFEQLIARAESCQKQIDAIVNPTNSASVHALSASKYTMPQAETVMIQSALRKEADAAMEELLGNLNLACTLYISANELVEGVALTAHDAEDQRKLHLYSASLQEKHRDCRRRAEELLIYS